MPAAYGFAGMEGRGRRPSPWRPPPSEAGDYPLSFQQEYQGRGGVIRTSVLSPRGSWRRPTSSARARLSRPVPPRPAASRRGGPASRSGRESDGEQGRRSPPAGKGRYRRRRRSGLADCAADVLGLVWLSPGGVYQRAGRRGGKGRCCGRSHPAVTQGRNDYPLFSIYLFGVW